MTETQNISIMAEKISQHIFSEFCWEQKGPINQNWDCVLTEEHSSRTHPSDVVFSYKDPYSYYTVYINCDLKSYKKTSIGQGAIGGAISSLTRATDCAQLSESWQELYLDRDDNAQIVGLLFVYNHDGAYDTEFPSLLSKISPDNYNRLRKNNRVFVLGPQKICYLNTIVNDIRVLRGINELPSSENCSFFYPDLHRRKVVRSWGNPATIEMLLSPIQVLAYRNNLNNQPNSGLLIYYRRAGNTIDEFLYLIDYLFHYQLLQTTEIIKLRLPYPAPAASVNFEKAKDEYIHSRTSSESLANRLSKINYSSVTNVVTVFSEIELGMENE